MIDFLTSSAAGTLTVSALAALEVRSAVRRREVLGEIDPKQAQQAVATLLCETARIQEQPITSALLVQAGAHVDRYSLRALDAIQLASAVLLKTAGGPHSQARFVASDQKLLKAAQAEGFEVWDPSKGFFRGYGVH